MIPIAQARPGDVTGMVRVHREAFPGFFLTSLGDRFLRRFYGALVADGDALCFVARSDDCIQGFVVGPFNPRGFFRRLLIRQGMQFIADAVPALFRRPLFVVRRLAQALFYRGEAPQMHRRSALVSSIAIRPAVSGGGVAAGLLQAFCDAAASRGAHYVYLLTDRDENLAANRFYAKSGFTLESEIVRSQGRTMNRYVRRLQDPRPHGLDERLGRENS